MNFDINKSNIGVYNKKCSPKYKLRTTPNRNSEINDINALNTSDIFKNKIVKNKYLIYKKSNLSETMKKDNLNSSQRSRIIKKYIRLKTKDEFLHKSNDKEKKKEEINPITKVKNIIKNIKLNLSLSTEKFNVNEKHNNLNSLVCNNTDSDDRNNSFFNNHKSSFLMNENKSFFYNNISQRNNQNRFKRINTSQILHECMNNVKKRLISNDSEKNNKKEERLQLSKLFTSANDYRTLKHHKIKKQLCMDLFNSNN
jgi:hypothetical protein